MSRDALSAPLLTTVIAVGVDGLRDHAETRHAFERTVTRVAGEHGLLSRDGAGADLVVALAPETAVDAALRRLNAGFGRFETDHRPLRIRAVIHYGVVFRSETAQGASCIGSAIRAASNALQKVPATGGIVATREFAEYAGTLPGAAQAFDLLADGGGSEDLRVLRFKSAGAAAVSAVDASLVDYLRKRLANDLGPIALPLVDEAAQSGRGASELIRALAREIANPQARSRFESDAASFLESGEAPLAGDATEGDKRGLLGRILKR